ncbi:MAG: primosomal replication protein N [Pseudomonadota bacterium]
MAASAANRICLDGRVLEAPERRHNPAGKPIARFMVGHESEQEEGGHPRVVQLRIQVFAAGEALQDQVDRLAVGDAVRIEGFVARSGYRQGDARLVLRANAITPIELERPTPSAEG